MSMIIRLDQKDIAQLINQQRQSLLDELDIDSDHPVAEMLEEHLDELYANILFRHEEVANEYQVPDSVLEKETEIAENAERAVKEAKEAMEAAKKAREAKKARQEAGEEEPEGEDGDSPAPQPIKLTEKEARKVVFGEKRSDWGKSL